MSSRSIEIRYCDRCDVVGEIREPWMGYRWGTMQASHCNGKFKVGRDKPADLCEGCMNELERWWKRQPVGA